MKTTSSFTKTQKLDLKATDFVYLDIESPTDYNKGTHPCISAIGYTDGRHSTLEYIKFSKACKVTDAMLEDFNSPPSEVYKRGRKVHEALKDLERFAKGRPILVFGDYDGKIIDIESNRFNLNLNLNLVDFTKSIVTPGKNYNLSLSRLVDLLNIEGDYVEHNPLDDAYKLKAVHEAYKDTPEFRTKAFQYYLESELKGIIKVMNAGVTRVSGFADSYLGTSEDVTIQLKTTLLETLKDELTITKTD